MARVLKKRPYENDLKLFKELCKMNKKKLQFFLFNALKEYGYRNIINTNTFLFAEGDLPICLCAHMDTVFKQTPYTFYYDEKETVVWSPSGMGADDRAGILIILKLLRDGYRPSIVFTDLEEVGGQGAEDLVSKYGDCPFEGCKALIQLDRRGYNDSVYYNCNNEDFEKLINSYGFKTNWGTFSDISILAPIWEIAGVNLSVGYDNEHTTSEILHLSALNNTYFNVKKMLNDCVEWNSFAYIAQTKNSYGNFFFDNDNRCVCCGNALQNYYIYHYDNEVFKVCPSCYSLCFEQTPLDE